MACFQNYETLSLLQRVVGIFWFRVRVQSFLDKGAPDGHDKDMWGEREYGFSGKGSLDLIAAFW